MTRNSRMAAQLGNIFLWLSCSSEPVSWNVCEAEACHLRPERKLRKCSIERGAKRSAASLTTYARKFIDNGAKRAQVVTSSFQVLPHVVRAKL
jgi:hypothetical protein